MLRLALVFLSLIAWREDATGASYYISPTGSDTTPGTCTESQPCATFQRCCKIMRSGDTCYARGGTYTAEFDAAGPLYNTGWSLFNCGQYASPEDPGADNLTFRGYPGETAIIKPEFYNECNCADDRGDGYGICSRDRASCGELINDGTSQVATITVSDARNDNITFSDLTIYGRLRINDADQPIGGGLYDWTSDNMLITRIKFYCPGSFGSGNCSNIMSRNATDTINLTTAPRQNLTIRNNLFIIDDTCPDYSQMALDSRRYDDAPDFTHLYSNDGLIIENNDTRINSTGPVWNRVGNDLTVIRYHFWTKGRAEHARIRYNYLYGAGSADAGISFNSGRCPDEFTNVCRDGRASGMDCTTDADCKRCNGGYADMNLCTVDTDCSFCVGGSNDTNPCTSSANCPGGSCVGTCPDNVGSGGVSWCSTCGIIETPSTGGTPNEYESEGDNWAYNNILDRAGAIAWDLGQYSQGDKIFNNTIYRPRADDSGAEGIHWSVGDNYRGPNDNEIFNNITYSPPSDGLGDTGTYGFFGWRAPDEDDPWGNPTRGHICKQAMLDYNIYYDIDDADPSNFVSQEFNDTVDGNNNGNFREQKLFNSLAAWKSWLATTCVGKPSLRETNSRETNPLFVDAANQDFRLQSGSPARTGGRGAGYPSYIGAVDPAGGQVFGCTFDPQCYGYTAPTVNRRTKVR